MEKIDLYSVTRSLEQGVESICNTQSLIQDLNKFDELGKSRKRLFDSMLISVQSVIDTMDKFEPVFFAEHQQRKDSGLSMPVEVVGLVEKLEESIESLEGLDQLEIVNYLKMANRWIRNIWLCYPRQNGADRATQTARPDNDQERAKDPGNSRESKEERQKRAQTDFIAKLVESSKYQKAVEDGTMIPGDLNEPNCIFVWKGSIVQLALFISSLPFSEGEQTNGKKVTKWKLVENLFSIDGKTVTRIQLTGAYKEYKKRN